MDKEGLQSENVCMNAYISVTLRTSTMKFSDNMSYQYTTINLSLEFSHASFRLHKMINIVLQA